MSNTTREVGPPREGGTLVRMRASVKAVATSPSVSTCVGVRVSHSQLVENRPTSTWGLATSVIFGVVMCYKTF